MGWDFEIIPSRHLGLGGLAKMANRFAGKISSGGRRQLPCETLLYFRCCLFGFGFSPVFGCVCLCCVVLRSVCVCVYVRARMCMCVCSDM